MSQQFWRTIQLGLVLVATLVFSGIVVAHNDTRAAPVPLAWTTLTLKHGWAPFEAATRAPAVSIDGNNIVRLRGVMAGGTVDYAFVLPTKFRPAGEVYFTVPTDNSNTGTIRIFRDGRAFITAPNFINASDFTSLEGVSFPKDGVGIE